MELLKTRLDDRNLVIFILEVIDKARTVYTIIQEEGKSEKDVQEQKLRETIGTVKSMFVNKERERWDYRVEVGLLFERFYVFRFNDRKRRY